MPASRRQAGAVSSAAKPLAPIMEAVPIALGAPPADSLDAALLAFHRQVERCQICSTIAPWRKFPLGRRGTARLGIMVLGEAPGRVSLENARPFSNPRNLTVRNAIARAIAPMTLAPEEVLYFSDTVKCWPSSPSGANRSPTAAENATCVSRHLAAELAIARPRVIFAFGARAAAAVLGRPVKMLDLHGVWIEAGGLRVLPLMHPSTINIAGMRKAGISSLLVYEIRLAAFFRTELEPLLAPTGPADP
ncbi:MAG: uracil-DNA glycosylase family protein [Candidatus Binataceae bacterium]|jgi:DNA polymerase